MEIDYAHESLGWGDYMLWSQSANMRLRDWRPRDDIFSTDLYAGGAPLNTFFEDVDAVVSEPSTLGLFGAGLFGLGFMRRKRAA